MKLEFAKMHGLGNDFMVLDLVSQALTLEPRLIQCWSDRHTGVGFDQLLVIEPPSDPDVDFRYRIFNADGSDAEQCPVTYLARRPGHRNSNWLFHFSILVVSRL